MTPLIISPDGGSHERAGLSEASQSQEAANFEGGQTMFVRREHFELVCHGDFSLLVFSFTAGEICH